MKNCIRSKIGDYERVFVCEPAWDRTNDPKGNFGIHGVHLSFAVVKKGRAVAWGVATPMLVPHLEEKIKAGLRTRSNPTAWCVEYHAPSRKKDAVACELTGRKCEMDSAYCDGDNIMPLFLAGGMDAVYDALIERYVTAFEGVNP